MSDIDEGDVETLAEARIRRSVCKTCNDDAMVMCTRCPAPCAHCRSGGNGPFCETTPCACVCHAGGRARAEKLAEPKPDPRAPSSDAEIAAMVLGLMAGEKAKERERVVAYLRSEAEELRSVGGGIVAGTIVAISDEIERGEHRK